VPAISRKFHSDDGYDDNDDRGWKVLYSSDGSGITTVKLTATLKADMDTVFAAIMDIDKRNEWDPYRKQELRRTIDKQNDILWMTMRPVDGRTKGGADFSFLRSWTRSENQIIIAVRSIDSDDVPVTPEYDRQYVFPSGYIISKDLAPAATNAALDAEGVSVPNATHAQTKVTYILQIGETLSAMYQVEIEGRATIVQNSFYQLCNYIESLSKGKA
jgi:uncharacterized protein YndB with AHSA1/START domain